MKVDRGVSFDLQFWDEILAGGFGAFEFFFGPILGWVSGKELER